MTKQRVIGTAVRAFRHGVRALSLTEGPDARQVLHAVEPLTSDLRVLGELPLDPPTLGRRNALRTLWSHQYKFRTYSRALTDLASEPEPDIPLLRLSLLGVVSDIHSMMATVRRDRRWVQATKGNPQGSRIDWHVYDPVRQSMRELRALAARLHTHVMSRMARKWPGRAPYVVFATRMESLPLRDPWGTYTRLLRQLPPHRTFPRIRRRG